MAWWTENKIRITMTIIAGIVAYGGLKTALASYQLNRNNYELARRARVAGVSISWEYDSDKYFTPPTATLSNTNDSLVTIDEVTIYGYAFQTHSFDLPKQDLHPKDEITFKVPTDFWFDILAMTDQSISRPDDYIDIIVVMRDIENVYWSRDATRLVDKGLITQRIDQLIPLLTRINLRIGNMLIDLRRWCSDKTLKISPVPAHSTPFWLASLDPLVDQLNSSTTPKSELTAIVTNRQVAPGRSFSIDAPRNFSSRDIQLASMYRVIYPPDHGSIPYHFHQGKALTTAESISMENLEFDSTGTLAFARHGRMSNTDDVDSNLDLNIPDDILAYLLNDYENLDSATQILGAYSDLTNQFVKVHSGLENPGLSSWLTRTFEPLDSRNFQAGSKVSSTTRALIQRFDSRLRFPNHGVAEMWVPRRNAPRHVPAVSRYGSDLAICWPRHRSDLTNLECDSSISYIEFIDDRNVHPYGHLAVATSKDGLTFPFPTVVDYSFSLGLNERLSRDICNYYQFNRSSLDGYREAAERFAKSVDPDATFVDFSDLARFIG